MNLHSSLFNTHTSAKSDLSCSACVSLCWWWQNHSLADCVCMLFYFHRSNLFPRSQRGFILNPKLIQLHDSSFYLRFPSDEIHTHSLTHGTVHCIRIAWSQNVHLNHSHRPCIFKHWFDLQRFFATALDILRFACFFSLYHFFSPSLFFVVLGLQSGFLSVDKKSKTNWWSRAHFNHVNMINVIKKSSNHHDIKSHEFFSHKSPQQGGRIFSLITHHSIFMENCVLSLSFLFWKNTHLHTRALCSHAHGEIQPFLNTTSTWIGHIFGFRLIASSCISRTRRIIQHNGNKNIWNEKKKIVLIENCFVGNRRKNENVTISTFCLPLTLQSARSFQSLYND